MTTDAGFLAPLISKIMKVFGVSLIEVSLLLSIMVLIPALLIPVFGLMADKFKRVLLLFFMVLGGAIVSLMMACITAYLRKFILFLIFGIVAAVMNAAMGPTLFSLLVDFVPSKNRASIIAWLGISGTATIGLGYIISGIIPNIVYGSQFPLWFPYLIDAVAGLAFSLLTLFLKEPPRGIQEEGLQELYESGRSYNYTLNFKGAKKLLKDPMNQRLILFDFFIRIRHALLGTYFITFLIENHGLNELSATQLMFVLFGIQLIGQIYFGRKGDEAYRHRKDGHLHIMVKTLGISLFFITWVFLIPFNFYTTTELILFFFFAIILIIGSFFEVGAIPSSRAILAEVNLPETRGTISSLKYLVSTIGRAVIIPLYAIICTNYLNNNHVLTFFIFLLFDIPAFIILLTMRTRIIPAIEKVQQSLKERVKNA
ncbi:MAG: MFS transporter [Promethearchaeota archaeon]